MADSNPITLRELASGSDAFRVIGEPDTVVSNVHYDSRLIQPGDLFVAIRGGRDDGHDHISSAMAAGAAACFVDRPRDYSLPAILTDDTRSRLPRLASTFFRMPSQALGVIGITGTDGKTTTSYLVDGILRDAGLVTGMIGTVSVRIAEQTVDHETRQTTPESLEIQRYLRQMVDHKVDWAILEATSHGLDLHRLDEVTFRIGAVTNIMHEHLEHHKTIAAYRRAKAILFERVSALSGVAVVNIDDAGAREMIAYAEGSNLVRYSSQDPRVDLFAKDVRLSENGATFTLVAEGSRRCVSLPYLGGFNVMNALCAIGIARAVGLDLDRTLASLARAQPIPGRMARVDAGQPFSIVVDYAHTPESLQKVLELLRSLHPTGKLICVSGSAGDRDKTKRPMQGGVSARLADFSVFTSEDPRFEDPDAIIDDIAAGARAEGRTLGREFFRVRDRREAISLAFELARPGDCVLLAGKGHERSMIWGDTKHPWDEAQVATTILDSMGHRGQL